MDQHDENVVNVQKTAFKHNGFNVVLNSVIGDITIRLRSQYVIRVKVFLLHGRVKSNDNQPDYLATKLLNWMRRYP